MPEAHVGVRALGDCVRRRRRDHRDVFRPRRAEQALNPGNDDVHLIARERITWTGPRICEVDVHQGGPLPEPDSPHETTTLVQLGIDREDPAERLSNVLTHDSPPRRWWFRPDDFTHRLDREGMACQAGSLPVELAWRGGGVAPVSR